MGFYEIASEKAKSLSKTEQELLQFTLRHMDEIDRLSIRDFASRCFVSTTTVFRFVKKLEFEGYSDFQDSINKTDTSNGENQIPKAIKRRDYKDSYLKNLSEALKVVSEDKANQFVAIMNRMPKIYILAEQMSIEVAHYMYRVLITSGYEARIIETDYEMTSFRERVNNEDVLLTLSYTGQSIRILNVLDQLLGTKEPTLISFTRADNNVIQNMSDMNFYIFADEMSYNGIDLTSRCGMIAIFETLIYQCITGKQ